MVFLISRFIQFSCRAGLTDDESHSSQIRDVKFSFTQILGLLNLEFQSKSQLPGQTIRASILVRFFYVHIWSCLLFLSGCVWSDEKSHRKSLFPSVVHNRTIRNLHDLVERTYQNWLSENSRSAIWIVHGTSSKMIEIDFDLQRSSSLFQAFPILNRFPTPLLVQSIAVDVDASNDLSLSLIHIWRCRRRG